MFSRKDLQKLIIPLIIEQVLAVLVGMVDTIMVSSVGEAAVSGVSLVDAIGILLISLFAALATGGSVVAAQYLGGKNKEQASKSAKQLLLSVLMLSSLIMVISLIGNKAILHLLFGDVDAAVMGNARTYFFITALSYPFLAVYNGCAALFRAMGSSKVSMRTSLIMNGLNILGNAIFLYGFKMGVEGVAIPTLISRIVAAVIMLVLIKNRNNSLYIDNYKHIRFDWPMIKRILHIGIPNGLENSMFQIGKILVQGIIASFGTSAITANAVAGNIAGLETIPGAAIGLSMITIVGQCIGANELEDAKKYIIKLLKVAYGVMIVLNIGVILFINPILSIYNLTPQTKELAIQLAVLHSIFCMIIWPTSFALPNALRAANDVRYTMIVSITSMWLFRIILSIIFAHYLNMGVMGVWIAMVVDWLFRSICFITRLVTGKWKKHAIIYQPNK
jgi:MATE family, multidrug efflux pump